ncbi:cyclopropane fatty acyl phospholipid synthase [Morganella psychrotolerans]|uniref:Cyclopropane fatty acyl phospholipid synthase n=1 Tax=Morganella psychrotolerans TaxID=368603 RepID=A0A5M9R5D1_9GAMM|nr:cyclopropane fatty acyl phospholipid synthase [Morganella psychrotolerans]KAA8714665.1 cyclopropane fatty acyl phospholipid synthase [Morganella psychrotolerans]OBU04417.1 cyclopropane-fatty-acyl-phospholipid synthase [Morganella psychrotolerans]
MNKTVSPDQKDPWYQMSRDLLLKAGVEINGVNPYDIQVNNNKFYKRVLQEGSLGLGDSYMDGWWDCEKIDELIAAMIEADLESSLSLSLKDLVRVAGSRLINLQSRKRAWIVGKEHYDLGNDLFSEMLDPRMQYSCGYWKDATDLDTAQQNKLKLICEKLKLQAGMTLLDIGCGWGGLAAYAAKNYGVKVTGVTISTEQKKLAESRCSGLNVEILLQDYRDLNRQFDRIVSVGMFEHVGPKNYDTYFRVANKCLTQDGIFLLHTIGSNKTDLNVDPWINKYIFPNGCIPSVTQISSASEPFFVIEDLHNFGSDYDKTLMAWFQRFESSWNNLEIKYTPRFKRMFSYYLNACAGAFRARNIQLWQVVFTKGLHGGLQVPR